MKKNFFRDAVAISGVFHNLYFNKPTPSFLANFRQGELLGSWPVLGNQERHDSAIALIERSLEELSDEQIERDYYRLFVGPGNMKAYPWGSVYTDRENLLYGKSCLNYSRFLKSCKIDINLEHHQPLDHIGLMFGVISKLIENEQFRLLDELLSEHVMPWAPRFLQCIDIGANSGFYRGMAMLTGDLLSALMEKRELSSESINLYK